MRFFLSWATPRRTGFPTAWPPAGRAGGGGAADGAPHPPHSAAAAVRSPRGAAPTPRRTRAPRRTLGVGDGDLELADSNETEWTAHNKKSLTSLKTVGRLEDV